MASRASLAAPEAAPSGVWRSPDEAPFGKWVLTWVHLPQNPQADLHVIAYRCDVEGRDFDPDPDGELGPYVEGCWWTQAGRYYAPVGTHPRVIAWMLLPDPPDAALSPAPPQDGEGG